MRDINDSVPAPDDGFAEDAEGTPVVAPPAYGPAAPAHDGITISKRALAVAGAAALGVVLLLAVFGGGVYTGSHFGAGRFGDRAGFMMGQGRMGWQDGAGYGPTGECVPGQGYRGPQRQGWQDDEGQAWSPRGRGMMGRGYGGSNAPSQAPVQ